MSSAIRMLSEELQTKSETELNEQPKTVQEDLRVIKKWLTDQSHFTARNEDQWLLSFLRGCKFSHKRTKEKLDMFYSIRTNMTEFFSNRDPFLQEIQNVLKTGIILPLRKTATPDGPRIILLRSESIDPTKILFTHCFKTATMIMDILLNEDDNFIIAGQRMLMDMTGLTMNHVVQVTPTICQKILEYAQNAFPSRPKGIQVINAPSIIQIVYEIVKPLVSEKIRKRITFYNEDHLEDFYKTIPIEVLPRQYGGQGDCLVELTDYWIEKVESYRDWFMDDLKYQANEKCRPTSNKFYGIYDSFKKLDID